MFGFLAPRQSIPAWRQSYARICQVQRQQFGITSLPFLSYEAAFLYQLAIDLQLTPELPQSSPQCCRLKRLKHGTAEADTAAAFAAAFGVVLLGIKLDDDVQDSGRWYHRLLRWKYRRQIRQARTVLRSIDENLPTTMADAIQRHAQLEQQRSPINMQEYSGPTADGFAAVFGAMSHAAPTDTSVETSTRLAQLGAGVGRAIIAWDCAVDFEQDQIRGDFNPLQDERDVQRSFDYCQLQLAKLAWNLPAHSTSAAVLASVTSRVRARSGAASGASCHRRLERWGLIKEKGFAYANCDCPCDGCGDCADCGACGDGGASAGCCDGWDSCGFFDCNSSGIHVDTSAGATWGCLSVPSCGDACCVGICECCGHHQEQQQADEASRRDDDESTLPSMGPYIEHVGQTTRTAGALNPSGYVLINDQRIPAKTQSGQFLDDGVAVKIVSCDAYGVSVVLQDEQSED